MGKIEPFKGYKCSDGKVFESFDEAQAHQIDLDTKAELKKIVREIFERGDHGAHGSGIGEEDLVDELMHNAGVISEALNKYLGKNV